MTPYRSFLWSSAWADEGWPAADGMSIAYTLPEIADELPTVTRSNDFELRCGENASFLYLSIYDESYARIYHNVTLDTIDSLPAGTYYVSIVVKVQGEYVSEAGDYEATGYECVFKMIAA